MRQKPPPALILSDFMNNLRTDATEIWKAGVKAVQGDRLTAGVVSVDGDLLQIDQNRWSRRDLDRVIVVGAGKASMSMAIGLVDRLQGWLPLVGWINVPQGAERSFDRTPLTGIHVHFARPSGVNEPTADGVVGAEQILRLVHDAGPRDLCVALISGGGSALLPAPITGITLDDKRLVTRFLSDAGADIIELNTVRKHLSRIKGGGLLRACRASHLVTLILSDVLGDPIDMIASGPTVPDKTSAADAIDVLRKYDLDGHLSDRIYSALRIQPPNDLRRVSCPRSTIVIGNNAIAVDEAGIKAESLGYNHAMQSARKCEGSADDVGRRLAEITIQMLRADPTKHRVDCLITGGEPTVALAPPEQRGRGGRNQHLVLSAYQHLRRAELSDREWNRLAFLSGGTDGEDGPTDAAGAVLDASVHRLAVERDLDVDDHLRRNDAYSFFDSCGGLFRTGATGTNVCDIRVVIIQPSGS